MTWITLTEKTSMGAAGETVEVSESRARWLIAHRMAKKEDINATTSESEKRPVQDEATDSESDDESETDADGEDDEDEADESEEVDVDDEEPALAGADVARPANSAPVREWADYARSRGAGNDSLKGMTKRQLIEQFG